MISLHHKIDDDAVGTDLINPQQIVNVMSCSFGEKAFVTIEFTTHQCDIEFLSHKYRKKFLNLLRTNDDTFEMEIMKLRNNKSRWGQ